MIDTVNRIEKLIKHLQISYTALAQNLEITQATLYHIRKGRNEISAKLAGLIVEKYPEINYEWLMSGKGNMLKEGVWGVKTYEYEVITFDSYDAGHQQRYINDKAKHGWELVSVVQFKDTDGTECFRFYFKRPNIF